MPAFVVGSPTVTATAGHIIQSVRAQIPDPVTDPSQDGGFVSLATLLRWMNDAMRIIATTAPVIQDYTGLQSQAGASLYELDTTTLDVMQLWYDLFPCARIAELDDRYVSKITARSYYFGPHTIGVTPRLHTWPASDRTGGTTTVSATMAATDTSFTVADASAFKAYGFAKIESEILWYDTISGPTISNVLRAQAGTTAAAHVSGATVTELNIRYKGSRLPTPLTGAASVIELPIGLTPLLELYVLAKVREAEQEHQVALAFMREFNAHVKTLANTAQLRGLRQGLQVRKDAPGPLVYFGRVVLP